MKVKELIERLEEMPQDLDVWYVWDGEPRSIPEVVFESEQEEVLIMSVREYVGAGDYPKGFSNTHTTGYGEDILKWQKK